MFSSSSHLFPDGAFFSSDTLHSFVIYFVVKSGSKIIKGKLCLIAGDIFTVFCVIRLCGSCTVCDKHLLLAVILAGEMRGDRFF